MFDRIWATKINKIHQYLPINWWHSLKCVEIISEPASSIWNSLYWNKSGKVGIGCCVKERTCVIFLFWRPSLFSGATRLLRYKTPGIISDMSSMLKGWNKRNLIQKEFYADDRTINEWIGYYDAAERIHTKRCAMKTMMCEPNTRQIFLQRRLLHPLVKEQQCPS